MKKLLLATTLLLAYTNVFALETEEYPVDVKCRVIHELSKDIMT